MNIGYCIQQSSIWLTSLNRKKKYIKLLAVFFNFVTASPQNITVPICQRRSRSFLSRDRFSFPNVSGQLCISMRKAGHEVFCFVTAFVTTLFCKVVSFTCVSVYRQAGHEIFCLVTGKAPFFLTKFFMWTFLHSSILTGIQSKDPVIFSDKNSKIKFFIKKLYHLTN